MRGSGGILLIGVAVVLIAASVTGRLDAIWSALKGGGSNGGDSGNGGGSDKPETPPVLEPDADNLVCPGGTFYLVKTGNQWKCYEPEFVSSPYDDGSCKENWKPGTTRNGDDVCVAPSSGNQPQRKGQAGFGSYNLNHLPTGFAAFRYAPNVR